MTDHNPRTALAEAFDRALSQHRKPKQGTETATARRMTKAEWAEAFDRAMQINPTNQTTKE